MLIAMGVHLIDRRRGRVQIDDGRTLRIVAGGDHHGRPCSSIVAHHMVAIDDGGAYAVDAMRMTATPLGAVVSSILVGGVLAG